MEIKDIRTRSDFIQFLNEWDEVDVSDEDADWFIAVANAKMIFENYSDKDLARDLLDGIKGVNEDREEAHAKFFESFFEDVDYFREEGDEKSALVHELDSVKAITEMLNDHFLD